MVYRAVRRGLPQRCHGSCGAAEMLSQDIEISIEIHTWKLLFRVAVTA
jgi:hypothetical protein